MPIRKVFCLAGLVASSALILSVAVFAGAPRGVPPAPVVAITVGR